MEEEGQRILSALLKFVNEENNYYEGELSIGREPVPGSSKAFYILKYRDMTLFTFWYSYETKPPKKVGATKHTTGGKKSFTKIMTQKLRDVDLGIKEAGFLTLLSDNLEWGTGKLINSKDKSAMKASDVQKIVKLSKVTFDKMVHDLKEKNLLTVNKDGYFISEELFAKGAK